MPGENATAQSKRLLHPTKVVETESSLSPPSVVGIYLGRHVRITGVTNSPITPPPAHASPRQRAAEKARPDDIIRVR